MGGGGEPWLARAGSAALLMVCTGNMDGNTGPGAFDGGSRGGFVESWGIDGVGGSACRVEAGGIEGFDKTGGGCTRVVLCSGVAVRSNVPVEMR